MYLLRCSLIVLIATIQGEAGGLQKRLLASQRIPVRKLTSLASPMSKSSSTSVYMGTNVNVESLPPAGDGSGGTKDMNSDVSRAAELNCQGGGYERCCWANAWPEPSIQWQKASGTFARAAHNYHYGYSGVTYNQMPKDEWLVALTNVTEAQSKNAILMSCPVPCANGDITIQFAQWTTEYTRLQACLYDWQNDVIFECYDAEKSDIPGPAFIIIPSNPDTKIRFRLAIVSDNYVDSRFGKDGGAAMIQDISVQYDNCPIVAITPPPPTTTTTTTEHPMVAIERECSLVSCDFTDDWCGWNQASGAELPNNGLDTAAFEYKPGGPNREDYRTGNAVTGVRSGPDGQYDAYIGANLDQYMQAGIANRIAEGLKEDRVIKFKWYMAIDRGHFVACCDGSCTEMTENSANAGTWGEWTVATEHSSFQCPKGTKDISITCVNDAQYVGGCGLADLEIFAPARDGNPANAVNNLCT